jgi:hypothetical protein
MINQIYNMGKGMLLIINLIWDSTEMVDNCKILPHGYCCGITFPTFWIINSLSFTICSIISSFMVCFGLDSEIRFRHQPCVTFTLG